MTTIPLVHAQAKLAETIERTKTGPVVLEESGEPVAIVLSIADYRRLSEAEIREHERASKAAYEQGFGPFDRGEFRELGDEDWAALAEGRRRFPHDPASWALPPKGQAG